MMSAGLILFKKGERADLYPDGGRVTLAMPSEEKKKTCFKKDEKWSGNVHIGKRDQSFNVPLDKTRAREHCC